MGESSARAARAAKRSLNFNVPPSTPIVTPVVTDETVGVEIRTSGSNAKALDEIKLQSAVISAVQKGGIQTFTGREANVRKTFLRLVGLLMNVFTILGNDYSRLLADFALDECDFDEQANFFLYGILYNICTESAGHIVRKAADTRDGRNVFLRLMREYSYKPNMASLTALEGKIHSYTIDPKRDPSVDFDILLDLNDQLAEMVERDEPTIVRSVFAALTRSGAYTSFLFALEQQMEEVHYTRDFITTKAREFYASYITTGKMSAETALVTHHTAGDSVGGVDANQIALLTAQLALLTSRMDSQSLKPDKGAQGAPPCIVCRDGSKHYFKDCPNLVDPEKLAAVKLAHKNKGKLKKPKDVAATTLPAHTLPDDPFAHEILGFGLSTPEVTPFAEMWFLQFAKKKLWIFLQAIMVGGFSLALIVTMMLMVICALQYVAPFFSSHLGYVAVHAGGAKPPSLGCHYLVIDSACTSHMFKEDFFVDFSPRSGSFMTQGKNMRFDTAGCGSAELPLVTTTGAIMQVSLSDVHYTPDGNFNLLSVTKLVEDFGWRSPDFALKVWSDAKGNTFKISKFRGLPVLTAHVSDAPKLALATASRDINTRDTSDWQFLKSACRHLALKYAPNGSWDIDCFTDGEGPVNGNSMAPAGYSVIDPVESHTLAGAAFWGSPPYTTKAITNCIMQVLGDCKKDPEGTCCMVILPVKHDAIWWHLTKNFEQVQLWPKGTTLYSCRSDGLTGVGRLVPAGKEGGPGRVFLAGTPWPVAAFFKNHRTPVTVDDYSRVHMRLAHYSAPYISHLIRQNDTLGVSLDPAVLKTCLPPRSCGTCQMCNMKRSGPFNTSDHSFLEDADCMQYTCSDIKGPMNPPSLNGLVYMVHFTCIKSRFSKLYFMSKKSEIVLCFGEFLSWCRQHGFKMTHMVLRTDFENVYVGGEMKALCQREGIKQTHSSAYLHEQNGFAEAIWRTLGELARPMLMDSKLPRHVWPLAWNHANDVKNCMPHSANHWRIPFSVIFGRHRQMSVFRWWGSVCFAYTNPDGRTTLDDRAEQGVYVGHSDSSRCYLVMDPVTFRVRKKGKVVVVEDLALMGKQLAGIDVVDFASLKLDSEHLSRKPSSFLKHFPVGSKDSAIRISNHSAYYDKEDHETVGILQCTSTQCPTGFWVSAQTFLLSALDDALLAYTLLMRYLQMTIRIGSNNEFFPVFTLAKSEPPGDYDRSVPGPYECVVVSTDTTLDPQMYGVVHHPSTNFLYMDISATDLKFSDPEIALVTGGARPFVSLDPKSIPRALVLPDASLWLDCIISEAESIFEDTRTIHMEDIVTSPPSGVVVIPSKPILNKKRNPDGSIEKYKCRVTARGDRQSEDSYDAIFSPVAGDSALYILLNIALQLDMHLKQVDVKTAFLNSQLDQEIWISLPVGFDLPWLREIRSSMGGGADCSKMLAKPVKKYARLWKALYGLKQANLLWYKLQNKFILEFDSRFVRSSMDACLYIIWLPNLKVLISVHVDDYAIATTCMTFYAKFIKAFGTRFNIKELGDLSFILQMKITRTHNHITISQERMIIDLALQYGLSKAKPKYTPIVVGANKLLPVENESEGWWPFRNIIGSLLWIARKTRPDIYWAVIYLACFCSSFGQEHTEFAKRVIKYLYTTRHYVLTFHKSADDLMSLKGYCDSDWAGNIVDRKSYSGFLIFMSGNLITWGTSKQHTVALSSAEAEYMSLSDHTREIMHLIHTLSEFTTVLLPVQINCDNQGAIYLSERATNNKRSRHIDTRFHFVRDHSEKGNVMVVYIETAGNLSDAMTKPVSPVALLAFVRAVLRCPT